MPKIDIHHPERSQGAFEQALRRIGTVEMEPGEILSRKASLKARLQIGLNRSRRGEQPTQVDGGALAIPTHLPLEIPPRAWEQVIPGTTVITGEFGGTNWKIYQARKEEDGSVALDGPARLFNHLDDRTLTFNGFVNRMAVCLANEYRAMKSRPDVKRHEALHGETPFIGAISLGFPQINFRKEGSPDLDAYLHFNEHGKGAKEWHITDYDHTKPRSLAEAMREQLQKLDVTNIARLAFINDTSAVLLDKDSASAAIHNGLDFFPNGAVGGSGTNINIHGINTELAHVAWSLDGEPDPIYERMYRNGWTHTEKPEWEHQTGQYLGYRIAASIQLLAERGFTIPAEDGHKQRTTDEIVEHILWNVKDNQHHYLLDRIADGREYAEPVLKKMVQRMMVRASQVYGILYAVSAEAALGERTPTSTPSAMLTEGNAILKGIGIVSGAEQTAQALGQPIKIIKAQRGAYGVTRLAMAMPYMEGHVVDNQVPAHEVVISNDLQTLPWENDILDTLTEVTDATGIDAWAGAGLLYRPFWNGKFGPHQTSNDKDVRIADFDKVRMFRTELRAKRPDARWSVDDRMSDIDPATLVFRQGSVRIKNGHVEVLISPFALDDLRQGNLRLDERVLTASDATEQAAKIERALGKVHKTVTEYPGLQLVGRLKELYAAQYGEHTPQEIITDWRQLAVSLWPNISTDDALLDSRFTGIDTSPSAPPVPKLAVLPEPLEYLRTMKERFEDRTLLSASELSLLQQNDVEAPDGFSTWFSYMVTHASDEVWREWLLNQSRSRKPFGGKDQDLQHLLSISRNLDNTNARQAYMGWPLEKHLMQSSLQIDTQDAINSAENNGLGQKDHVRIRTALRMASLCADLKPTATEGFPGWIEGRPNFVDEETSQLVEWLIDTRSVFGEMLLGAITPEQAQQKLSNATLPFDVSVAIHKALWKSEVESISNLRWMSGLGDNLEQAVKETN